MKSALGSNLLAGMDFNGGADIEFQELRAENAELLARVEALTRESNSPLVHVPEAGVKPLFARVSIILEENDGIAPSGQYFGLHGNWVNPETLEALEPQVLSGELTRQAAQLIATEKVQFEAYLRPGEEAAVPVELLSILNDAMTDAPIIDPITSQVLGYKTKLRYPYRLVTSANRRIGH